MHFFGGALRVKRVVQVGENFQSLTLLNYLSSEVKEEGIDYLGNFLCYFVVCFFLAKSTFSKDYFGNTV